MLLESSGPGAYFETLPIERKISRDARRARHRSDHIVDAGVEEAMAAELQGDISGLVKFHWRCSVASQCLGR